MVLSRGTVFVNRAGGLVEMPRSLQPAQAALTSAGPRLSPGPSSQAPGGEHRRTLLISVFLT